MNEECDVVVVGAADDLNGRGNAGHGREGADEHASQLAETGFRHVAVLVEHFHRRSVIKRKRFLLDVEPDRCHCRKHSRISSRVGYGILISAFWNAS